MFIIAFFPYVYLIYVARKRQLFSSIMDTISYIKNSIMDTFIIHLLGKRYTLRPLQ